MMQYIYIQPVENIDRDLLSYLATELEKVYKFQSKINSPLKIDLESYNSSRKQFDAKILLYNLDQNLPRDAIKLFGVVDMDIYVKDLNFVFGLAGSRASLISLVRLRPEFYGKIKDDALFKLRALKEAIHELGHTFGLEHCPNQTCIMHFSNSISDTDIKGPGFCESCSIQIKNRLHKH